MIPGKLCLNGTRWANRIAGGSVAIAIAIGLASNAWSQSPASETEIQAASEEAPTAVNSAHLPNAFWIHKHLLSGGLPHGEEAFQELAELGIKTILSVDGIRPQVDLATKHGMRYVHLPHGYEGISDTRQREIAKALRDLPKPIYLHCHHGKHRGPTAAATGCIINGWLSKEAGERVLRVAGTNPAFLGLYQTVQRAQPAPRDEIDRWQAEFTSIAPLPPMTEAMVAIDAVHDRLLQARKEAWSNVNLETSSDALILKEHFLELERTESEFRNDHAFQALVREGQQFADELEAQLLRIRSLSEPEAAKAHADQSMDRIRKNCAQCHTAFRDRRPPNQ